MKKIKIKSSDSFGSLNTKYTPDSPHVDASEFTAGTKNLETSVKGIITKRKGGVVYSTLPNPPRDQYEAIFSDGVRHLLTVDNGNLRYSSGDGNETTVLTGLSAGLNFEFANTQDRVYFGNGIQKKVYDRTTSYGGVSYTFPSQTVKDMGLAAPSSAPTVALVVDSTVNQVPAGSHTYKVTYVYYNSEESNGGTASSAVVNDATHTSNSLTSIPVGGYGVTQRKIYRDNNDGVYVLVGVLLNNTATTFTDTLSAGLTPIPDDQGTPPDFTLISLYLDRLFLAGIPGDPYFLYFSEVSMPDIYPSANTIPCNQEDPITGIVKYSDRLVVFNRRSMGQIVGKTSDQFRYAEIEPSVGCVDNRTIQIRVIDGVPVLVWLSDKGFYAYNGNSVVYISDSIEDQVNSNIQQAVIQKNKISQSDYTAFSAGTLSNGVNIEANPGTITNKGPYWDTGLHPLADYDDQTNPKLLLDSQDEWENGTSLVNVVTDDGTEALKAPVRFIPTLASGSASNVVIDGSDLELSTYGSDFTGIYQDNDTVRILPSALGVSKIAYPIQIPRGGTVTRLRFPMRHTYNTPGLTQCYYRIMVWNDNAGFPGSVAFTGATQASPLTNSYFQVDQTIVASISGSGNYWIGAEAVTVGSKILGIGYIQTSGLTGLDEVWTGSTSVKMFTSSWLDIPATGNESFSGILSYTFSQAAVASSGSWVSPIYDSLCDTVSSGLSVSLTGVYPAGSYSSGPYSTSSVTRIEASDDLHMVSGVVTEDVSNLNGSSAIALSLKRYWRLRITLSTTDDRVTPSCGDPKLQFNAQGTWESEVIDCTSDVTSYTSLVTTKSEPSGTSVVTTIATSDDNITYTPYVSFGSHTVKRYAKIKQVLNTDAGNTVTPSVSAVELKWSVTSTFISDEIDLGVDPSGFDIFQASFNLNGGTIVFSMRSASSQVGLSSATWYTVTNGEFPDSALPTLQWVQWRAVITSNPDQVPTIESVTIGWFVGSDTQSIRAASIFYNKNYYVSLSEFENDYNNIVFVLDFEGKWRVFRDLNIATLSYFFNNPYYGDATNGDIVRFLEGNSDQGDPIELQVNTKAYDGSTEYSDYEDKMKVLDHVLVSVKNTGATYDISYSVDEGMTFNLLYDTSGASSWTVGTDGKETWKYLRPNYETAIPTGRTIMFKIHNNDTKECEIKSWKAEAFVRLQPPIITG